MPKIILFFALIISASSASLATTVHGYGNESCGKWTEAHSRGSKDALGQDAWLNGFVSAFNLFGGGDGNVAKGVDPAGMRAWVSDYCQKNPLDPIVKAAGELVMVLRAR